MIKAIKENYGFSLVELLVVIVIIAIIAAIAIPNLLSSRRSANQASAIANLRTVATAQATYFASGGGTYGTFADVSGANLLDATWTGTPTKSGYEFELILGTGGAGYCSTATRLSSSSGDNSFSVSHQSTVYQLAGDTSPSCDPDTGLMATGTVLGS
jgi:type IV pilus assembly protein PilA